MVLPASQCVTAVDRVGRERGRYMETHRRSAGGEVKRLLVPVMAMATVAGGSLAVTSAPAHALTSNLGYACGYHANIKLGSNGKWGTQGCAPQSSREASTNSLAPSVNLPTSGSINSKNDADGAYSQFGPAVMFSSPYDALDNLANSGAMDVSTGGTTTITSTSQANGVGPSPFWTATPTSWLPSTGAPWNDGSVGYVKAQCTATSPTSTGSTVEIKNGRVDTSLDANGYPATWVDVPFNPSPNYTVPYVINTTPTQDHGEVVFNERINHADGSFTVNAMHMKLMGPYAWGDLIIGQVKCGHI